MVLYLKLFVNECIPSSPSISTFSALILSVSMTTSFCYSGAISDLCWNRNAKHPSIVRKDVTLSFLMTTKEAFVDSVDQNQTVQNVQYDL